MGKSDPEAAAAGGTPGAAAPPAPAGADGHAGYQFGVAELRPVLACLQPRLGPPEKGAVEARVLAAVAALRAFEPRDAVEGMLAAQAVAAHHAAMECLRRANEPGGSPEVASRLRRDAAAMVRASADLLEALDRRRGKTARQMVRVARVTVQAGGQAIVGAVGRPAGGGGGGG